MSAISKSSPSISFADALTLTLQAVVPKSPETIPLAEAVHRILAIDVTADVDMPPFNKSAMDGYACRRSDLSIPLEVADIIAAGQRPNVCLQPGQCAKIMTGAPVPDEADCVVMVEHTRLDDTGRVLVTQSSTGSNICPQAEDVAQGDTVLHAGQRLLPAHVAMLAAAGVSKVPVYQRPKVGIIATGKELVEPGAIPAIGQIRNSNSYQLLAQTAQLGLVSRYYGIADDNQPATEALVATGKQECEVLLISGGVSMGDYDYVPEVLTSLGFQLAYRSVAMQPGHPTVFGTAEDGTYCFGLPGNPVSALVVFEMLLKPFLYQLMGHNYRPTVATATLQETFERKKARRQLSIPVRFIAPDKVSMVEYHGSAHIHAFCKADGIITLAEGQTRIEQGSTVHVRFL